MSPASLQSAAAARRPLVSVTIPVWNGAAHVADAIASVLGQSYGALELIVVDDGSGDDTPDIVSRVGDSRCRLVRQPRGGAGGARNRGVAESSGSLLAFLDADDMWMHDKLAVQVRALADDPGLDMVFGHYVTSDERTDDDRVASSPPAPPQPGLSPGTVLVRRESFVRVGPFSSRWRVGEFVDWYARAMDAGLRHRVVPDIVMARRVHYANLTGRNLEARRDYAAIVRAAVNRRRGRGSGPWSR